jgi:hypothetical protein
MSTPTPTTPATSPTLTFTEESQGQWRHLSRIDSGWSEFRLSDSSKTRRGRTHSGTDSDDSSIEEAILPQSPLHLHLSSFQPEVSERILVNAIRRSTDSPHVNSNTPSQQLVLSQTRVSQNSPLQDSTPRNGIFLTSSTQTSALPPLNNQPERISSSFYHLFERFSSLFFSCTICSSNASVESDIVSPPILRPPLTPSFSHISGTGELDDPLVLRVVLLNDQAQDGRGGNSSPLPGLNPASPHGLASRVGTWEERREARSRRTSHWHE